ncbi:uncharacterized [Tachysurus ichikawai]
MLRLIPQRRTASSRATPYGNTIPLRIQTEARLRTTRLMLLQLYIVEKAEFNSCSTCCGAPRLLWLEVNAAVAGSPIWNLLNRWAKAPHGNLHTQAGLFLPPPPSHDVSEKGFARSGCQSPVVRSPDDQREPGVEGKDGWTEKGEIVW